MDSQFDWYQATVPETTSQLIEGLCSSLEGSADVQHLPRGRSGYKATALIVDGKADTLAVVLHGGNPHPNVIGSGKRAPALADALRGLWPDHRVSRLDVCADFQGEGTFQALVTQARLTAEEHRLSSGLMFDPDDGEKGHTYRLGSTASPVVLRIYEKGLEQLGKGVLDADPNWVRMELQVRPQRKAKNTFASARPAEVWGASGWSQALAERVSGEAPPRLNVNPLTQSTWEATQAHLVAQYRRHMLLGGEIALGDLGGHEHSTEELVRAYAERLVQDLLRQAS